MQYGKCIKEDLNVCNGFLIKYPGHGSKTVSALRDEIKKYEERLKNNIKVFIEKTDKKSIRGGTNAWLPSEERFTKRWQKILES